jgi:GT2 family glycosyltransferase
LFFLYYEETDWCVRVRRAGFRIVYAPLAKIWHKGLVGNANLPLTPKRIFYLQRYEIPFIQRNASSEQWRAYVRRLLVGLPYKLLRYAKHGRFRAMLAYFKGVSCGVFWVWRNAVVRRMPDRPNG